MDKKKKTYFSMLLTAMLLVCGMTYGQNNTFKVTLDAGHGAHDFGAVYSGRIEKNIALAIVLKVGTLLESYANVEVTYTRKTDIFIDLVERANIANRANANIFVSIHCNANKNTTAFGTETYVMGLSKTASNLEAAKNENSVITLEKDYKRKYEGFDPNSPESMIGMTLMQEEYLDYSISLASKVESEFEKLGKKLRQGGVKQAPFMVLHKAYMPRVLIETGFISNPEEGDLLNSEVGQNEVAKAIADAIISYKKEYFGSGIDEVIEVKPVAKVNPTTAASEASASVKAVEGVIFKIQLVASTKKMGLNPSNFKGLSPVSMVNESNVYKYTYQQTADYAQAQVFLNEAKSKGYASAFLVAFKNGQRINIQDALK